MSQLTLITAQQAYTRCKDARQTAIAKMYAEAPHVVEHLNNQIEEAIGRHEMFISLTKQAIESVPGINPDAFVAFMRAEGFTLLAGPQKDTYRFYFYDPTEEQKA